MKQSTILALTASVLSVNALSLDDLSDRELAILLRRGGLFGGDSTQNINAGAAGNGAAATAGAGGQGGDLKGHKAGNLGQAGANAGHVGTVKTDLSGSNNGQQSGNSGMNTISGTINQAAPLQFGMDMWSKGANFAGATLSGSSFNAGGDSSISGGGVSGNRLGGFGDGNGNGGAQKGSADASGAQTSKGAKGGKARGGNGGTSQVGGGNSSKGGDSSMSLSVPVSPVRRDLNTLHARALALEDEYTWVIQQRDLAEQELNARYAEPEFEYEEEFLAAREEDPEAEMFYARDIEADFDWGLFEDEY